MSSAFYPLGMNSYNNRLPQGGFKPWKGDNPVGITAGNIRPLTNNDIGNDFKAAFGEKPAAPGLHCRKPRPLKQYRKGSSLRTPILPDDDHSVSYENYITADRNINRQVASSTYGTLVKQMIDNPGSFSLTEKTKNNPDQRGVCVVSSYYPNKQYLTENPEESTTNYPLCCNAERKARRRCLPASTNLKQNYYTTLQQYRENRCQTYEQRSFNFVRPAFDSNPNAKPGGPLSESNTYVANCQPNIEISETNEINSGPPLSGPENLFACKLVVYKPNNYQFAQQGGVSSSTLTLKKNVTTIEKNLLYISKNNRYIYKNKAPPCNPALYTLNGQATACHSIKKISPILSNAFYFRKNKSTL
jgi:hypothetical protein